MSALAVVATAVLAPPALSAPDDGLSVSPDACDGTWHTMPIAPNNTKSRELLDVVALSASDVWAVGKATPRDPSFPRAYVMHWDGAEWSPVSTPVPAGSRSSTLRSVTAVSPTNVVAVGEYENADGTAHLVLAMRWNGTSWKLMSTGILGTQAYAYGVEAINASNIWMVGNQGPAGSLRTFSARWNGSKWSAVSTPNKPGSDQNFVNDVAGTAANDLWAVGAYTDSQRAHGLTMHWNGSKWSIVNSPDSFELLGVTAITPSLAWSSGWTFASTYETERWNGSSWSARNSDPVLAGRASSIDDAGKNDIWAAGTDDFGRPLMQHWNGADWVKIQATVPDAAARQVGGVSVLSNGSRAYAVGASFNDPPGVWRPLIMKWC